MESPWATVAARLKPKPETQAEVTLESQHGGVHGSTEAHPTTIQFKEQGVVSTP